jgi:hypothetical protein
MPIMSGKMGAASGDIIGISDEVFKELQAIAEENQALGLREMWDDTETAILLKFQDTVSYRGLVKMLRRVSPEKNWTIEAVRSKARRMGLTGTKGKYLE